MNAQLRITPADRLAQHAAAKTEVRPAHLLGRVLLGDVPIDELEQPPGLRRQLIERAAEHLVRKRIGERDVVERRPRCTRSLGRRAARVRIGRWC